MTVKELKELCEQAILLGLGDRAIFISDDEEGNGYHPLVYGLTNDPDVLDEITEDCNVTIDDIIVLG